MNTNSINSPFKTFDTNFRSHFDDFSLHSRDLNKMRLKQEIAQDEETRRDHYRDMRDSFLESSEGNTNYIYKPVYNYYFNEYKEKSDNHKKQLESYNTLQNYLTNILENGSLSDTQLENTRREQKEILREMNKIQKHISSITNIDPAIK